MKRNVFFERTIRSEIILSGKALFTGEDVEITLLPAQVGEGILFKKIISPNKCITIAATQNSIYKASGRNTVLSDGTELGVIHCVEHLMSALFGCGISNVVIEIKGSEVPIFDGSAKPIVEAIIKAGLFDQELEREFMPIDKPYYWSKGNVHIIALPSEEMRFSYTLSYEDHPLLNSQFFTIPYNENWTEKYCELIAPARTFCLYEEAQAMMKSGMIKGGTLDCAVVVKGSEILNPEGLRFNDEMVRHKVLDMIGDLALLKQPLLAHFIGIRSGHEANAILAKKIACNVKISHDEIFEGVQV